MQLGLGFLPLQMSGRGIGAAEARPTTTASAKKRVVLTCMIGRGLTWVGLCIGCLRESTTDAECAYIVNSRTPGVSQVMEKKPANLFASCWLPPSNMCRHNGIFKSPLTHYEDMSVLRREPGIPKRSGSACADIMSVNRSSAIPSRLREGR